MDWQSGSGLSGCADPAEVDAAFARGEPLVGVAVIGLSLSCDDSAAVLDRVVRALESNDPELRRQGLVALGNVARLDGAVNAATLAVLRRMLTDRTGHPGARMVRGSAENAADDIGIFVPRSGQPGWLRRHQRRKLIRWRLWDRWPWSGWSRWRRRQAR